VTDSNKCLPATVQHILASLEVRFAHFYPGLVMQLQR